MIQALTLLGAFGVGIVLSFLGAVKLALAQNLNISDVQVSGLISALMFSCVIGALIAGPLVDALGQKRVIIFGFALSGGCIMLIANTRSYHVVVAACLLLGVGALCVSTVSSTLAPVTLFGGKTPPPPRTSITCSSAWERSSYPCWSFSSLNNAVFRKRSASSP
jgi:MFS family permease